MKKGLFILFFKNNPLTPFKSTGIFFFVPAVQEWVRWWPMLVLVCSTILFPKRSSVLAILALDLLFWEVAPSVLVASANAPPLLEGGMLSISPSFARDKAVLSSEEATLLLSEYPPSEVEMGTASSNVHIISRCNNTTVPSMWYGECPGLCSLLHFCNPFWQH